MKSSIRRKLLLLIALLSLAMILSSVLVSSRLYESALKRNQEALCAETAGTLSDSLSGAHVDFLQSYRSKLGAIYAENRELLEEAAGMEFESNDRRAAFYESLTEDIFPPKQGLGLSYEMLEFKLEYDAVCNEMDMLSLSGGLDLASLFFYDPERGNLVYMIDRMPEGSALYHFPVSASKLEDETLAAALESGSPVTYVRGAACRALLPVPGAENVFILFGKRNMDLSRSVRLFSLYVGSILLGATLFIGLGILLFADRLIVRNVKKLSTAAERFTTGLGRGDPERISTDVKGRDEIGVLSQRFELMEDAMLGYLESLADKTAREEKMKAELDLAARIQAESLPQGGLRAGNAVLSSFLKPAREVGGDLYDYFLLDENRMFFCLADVSGKGVPASLFMMRAKELIRAHVRADETLSQLAYQINNELCAGNEESIFITAFFGVLELRSGKLSCLRAGHEQPMLRRGAQVLSVCEESNSVLGVFEDMPFQAEELSLEPGDLLLMFTDGLNEGINPAQEAFGYERIAETLKRCRENPTDTLYGALLKFCDGAEQFDDVTMLALYLEEPKSLEIENPSYDDISAVTDFVRDALAGCDPDRLAQVGILVDEIMNNQISYAFAGVEKPLIRVSVSLRAGEAELCFADNGRAFDPLKDVSAEDLERSEGGLGLEFVRAFSDAQRYERKDGFNRLLLTKKMKDEAATGYRGPGSGVQRGSEANSAPPA